MVSSEALEKYLTRFRKWLQDASFDLGEPHTNWETWNGCVSVEWTDSDTGEDSIAEHRLSIVLPVGFPYRAPIVVSKDNPPLAPSWHLSPEPSHSLCLWDAQTGWQPHFTAQRLLSRIEDWFCHYHTGQWPENSQVPDLYRYLECRGVVVIGEEWVPPQDNKSGRFTFWQHQPFYRSFPCLAVCYEDGHIQLDIEEAENRLVKNLLVTAKTSKRIPGVWFRLTEPIVPPDSLKGLLDLIEANLGLEPGAAGRVCLHALGRKFSEVGFPIALGYTINRDAERWLFLWARLSSDKKKKSEISWSKPESQAFIKLESFRTAPARKSDLLRRSQHLSKQLGARKVAIFGVGALGSSVVVLLAKAGISEIYLVDDDILMPGNVIRHICGLQWVGSLKTQAVERIVHSHNPDCHVSCYSADWDPENLRKYIEGCDVVVDTTANRNFSLYLNEICIDCNQSVVFAAAYRRAAIGRMVVRRNDSDPCLACYVDAAQFWRDDEYPTVPTDPGEVFLEDGCGVTTEEAAALDVEAAANLTARIVIDMMRDNLGGRNLAVLVTEALPNMSGILAQEGIHWRSNRPLASCAICRGQ